MPPAPLPPPSFHPIRADLLDPALMRPGRFDRKIRMPKPDTEGRYEILKLHLKSKKVWGLCAKKVWGCAPRALLGPASSIINGGQCIRAPRSGVTQ